MNTLTIDRIAEERFMGSLAMGPVPLGFPELGPCWIWAKGTNRGGYGNFHVAGKTVGAHRFSYAMVNGPAPAGAHIDHLCSVKRCVRPDHLDATSASDNVRRDIERRRAGRMPLRADHARYVDYLPKLAEILVEAGETGVETKTLYRTIGCGRMWLHARLSVLAEIGLAERVSLGRWRALASEELIITSLDGIVTNAA